MTTLFPGSNICCQWSSVQNHSPSVTTNTDHSPSVTTTNNNILKRREVLSLDELIHKDAMSTEQNIQRIIELYTLLDPRAVSAEVSLMTGARLKSSWPAGGRASKGAPPPMNELDAIDRMVRGKHKRYREDLKAADKLIGDACRLLEFAKVKQDELLARMHDEHGHPTEDAQRLAAEAVSPQADTCANCARVVERTANDKLLAGRCRACYDYQKAKGVERPRDLWESA